MRQADQAPPQPYTIPNQGGVKTNSKTEHLHSAKPADGCRMEGLTKTSSGGKNAG